MVGHGGSSAGSYLADPTSPIPSHCAWIVVTSTLRVKSHWRQCTMCHSPPSKAYCQNPGIHKVNSLFVFAGINNVPHQLLKLLSFVTLQMPYIAHIKILFLQGVWDIFSAEVQSKNYHHLNDTWYKIYFGGFKHKLGQKYYAPQVRPDWGSNSWPPDHDGTFHVTETPASNHLAISDSDSI